MIITKMKKLVLLFAVVVAVSFASCGNKEKAAENQEAVVGEVVVAEEAPAVEVEEAPVVVAEEAPEALPAE
jgi:ABC-type phosphate transport system auxiliary subunit